MFKSILIFLQNKEINALIYGQRYNLFDLRQKFIWFEQIFICSKDILYESNKFCFIKKKNFFTSKKVFQTNNFLIQSNIFSEYTWSTLSTSASKFQPVEYSWSFVYIFTYFFGDCFKFYCLNIKMNLFTQIWLVFRIIIYT